MSSLSLKVDVLAGTDIEIAFIEAASLAYKTGVTIEFRFNGVTCFARGNGDPKKGAKSYHEALKEDFQYKFARNY